MSDNTVSVSAAAYDISARNDEHTSLTFAIVIGGKEPETHMACFPFAGTIEQAYREAKRIVSCFNVKIDAIVMAWFEVEDN